MNFVALVADCFISTIWHHFLGQVRPNAKWSPRLALFTSFYSLAFDVCECLRKINVKLLIIFQLYILNPHIDNFKRIFNLFPV